MLVEKLLQLFIAKIDTNSDPRGIDYVIPANDDAMRSIKLFAHRISDVYLEGQEMKKASQQEQAEEKSKPSNKADTPPTPDDKDKNETVVPA